MKVFGLIGHPLTHSFSKRYFDEKFKKLNLYEHEYHLFDIDNINKIVDLKTKKNLVGLNVTIPYKEVVLPFLDEISDIAKQIGSVNAIKCIANVWKGFNTDYIGIADTLNKLKDYKINGCLVLGTGGTSKTVCYVLKEMNIQTLCISRNKNNENTLNYSEINKKILEKYNLIINTTPLGMYPHINDLPDLPYHLLRNTNILFDMIYNPSKTAFLSKGEEKSCITINGLNSLHVQAEESWKIWNS